MGFQSPAHSKQSSPATKVSPRSKQQIPISFGDGTFEDGEFKADAFSEALPRHDKAPDFATKHTHAAALNYNFLQISGSAPLLNRQTEEGQEEQETEKAEIAPRLQTKSEEDEESVNSTLQRSENEFKEKEDDLQMRPQFPLFSLADISIQGPNAQSSQSSSPPNLLQAKLTIGQPGDKYEQEADRTAAQVMAMPDSAMGITVNQRLNKDDSNLQQRKSLIAPLLQRAQQDKKDKPVQTKPKIALPNLSTPQRLNVPISQLSAHPNFQLKGKPLSAPNNFEAKLANHRGGGQPLSPKTRSFMEPRFGADFSGVRIHQAPKEAGAIGAQAFTHGQDIYFNSGKYNPGSSGGKELLAHELTHTIQQTGGKIRRKSNKIHLKLGSAPAEALADDQQTDAPTSDLPAAEPTQSSAPATVEPSTQLQQQSQPAQSASPIESRGATDAKQSGENSGGVAIAPIEANPTEVSETPAEQESQNTEKEHTDQSQSDQAGSDASEAPTPSGAPGAGASRMETAGGLATEQSSPGSAAPTEANQEGSASTNALGAAPAPLPQGDMAVEGQGTPGAAAADVAMPPVSPEQDPDFQATVAQSEGAATTSQRHAPATAESQAAQAAAQSPTLTK